MEYTAVRDCTKISQPGNAKCDKGKQGDNRMKVETRRGMRKECKNLKSEIVMMILYFRCFKDALLSYIKQR